MYGLVLLSSHLDTNIASVVMLDRSQHAWLWSRVAAHCHTVSVLGVVRADVIANKCHVIVTNTKPD